MAERHQPFNPFGEIRTLVHKHIKRPEEEETKLNTFLTKEAKEVASHFALQQIRLRVVICRRALAFHPEVEWLDRTVGVGLPF